MRFLALLLWAGPLWAQAPKPRSLDYLNAASVDDVRASWLNPAGLARVPEASVMAEVVVDRPPAGDLRVAQYTLGMNSRGLSFSFARDRGEEGIGVNIFRFGLGLPLGRTASLGWAVSLYRGATDEEAIDLGIRWGITRALELGAVVRNLSEPTVRGTVLPVTALLAATWSPLWQRLEFGAEAHAVKLPAEGVYQGRYRGGLRLATGGTMPLRLVLSVDLKRSLSVDRWTAGLVLGGHDQVGLLGTARPAAGQLGRLDRFSALGLSSRRAASALH